MSKPEYNNSTSRSGAPVGAVTSGRNFFDASGRRGELQEFKEELNHASKEKKKEALKKVIQAMTVGSDVSSLFPDVVNCMQTSSLDLKKLVYLYVINYAKAQPDLAILAIHSFRKDSNDVHNPLLRALAVRTMGCIRLEQMTEYLLEPLRKSCKDPDAYVRKTATICIAKLFDINPELVEDQGFIDILRDMLGDANPMVVANAVASLSEISSSSQRDYLRLNDTVISKLLPALSECSEWHQVFILDALSTYDPPSSRSAEMILERGVMVRLSHANSAVVLSAVKVMMKYMDRIQSPEVVRSHCKKMTPPLVTLLSAEPEIQYVVMRNINLIVQKQPQILQQDVRMFVCKYNDPLYVKLEKIAVMVQLASEKNVDLVLIEFREYASEVDIEVVRKSVRAIGQCAIKLGRAAERCVDCLLDLIKTKVNYVVQEAIVVIRDIFRKYPGKYEIIISDLCENLDNLDEPEAKASMVWIVGEYAERIDNSSELLESFLETFHEEPAMVQLQLLTATVKLCLKCPGTSRELVGRVLKVATDECTNPDLRDRGYMYWRMLISNPEVAKQVVLSERPTISDESFACQPKVLDKLVANISTLASVYHQLPEAFLDQRRTLPARESGDEEEEEEAQENVERVRREMQMRDSANYVERSDDERVVDNASSSGGSSSSGDEASGGKGAGRNSQASGGATPQARNPPGGSQPPPPPLRGMAQVLAEGQAGQSGRLGGLRVAACILRGPNGAVGMQMMVGNFGSQPMSGWAVQFNKNAFGFAPSGPIQLPEVQPGGDSAQTTLPLTPNTLLSGQPPSSPLYVEVALKTNQDVFYYSLPYDLSAVLTDSGPVPQETFQQTWTQVPVERKARVLGQFSQSVTAEMVVSRCRQYFLYVVNQTSTNDADNLYMSCGTLNRLTVFCELSMQRGGSGVQLVATSDAPPLVPLFQAFVSELLRVRWMPQPAAPQPA
eukprot:TRINITY_DN31082_c0_g1_i1.p1 TRINITY_DN31082_c0_g1~~TRINITY_DN31082_c0_g1_i1.p1  ORF type:complete len:954 (+),score=202.58 TRINITY_DN31082_c0_g1_i1:66-2927(+)